MGRYLKKIFELILSFFALAIFCFCLVRFFPGQPLVDETGLDPIVLESLKKSFGLDQDFFTQLLNYFKHVITLDFGKSIHFAGRSVMSLIADYGAISVRLGLLAFLMSILSTFVLVVFSRIQSESFKQRFDLLILMISSVPNLAIIPVVVYLFAVRLQWLPVALLEGPESYILPVLLLALKPALSLIRLVCVSLDENLLSKPILVGRSLGFSEFSILTKWAMKGSLISMLSQLGPILSHLISGSFLIEVIFAIPGIGYQFVQSILNRDWPLILGMTLVYGFILILSNWITDICIDRLTGSAQSQMELN